MPLSYTQYTGNGSTTDFMLSFPYLNKAHVILKVNSVNTAFTWVNASTIRTASAPKSGELVWIYRVTPRNEALTTFSDNAGFREADLNRIVKQLLYISQEAYENADLPTLAEWREEFRQGLAEMRSITEQTQAFITQFGGLIADAEAALDAYTNQKEQEIDTATAAAIAQINQTTTGLESGMQEIALARQEIAEVRVLLDSLSASIQTAKAAAESAASTAQTAKTAAESAATAAQTAATAAESARTGAQTSLANAQTIETSIGSMLTQTVTRRDETLVFRNETEGFKNTAEDAAQTATAAAQTAFGAAAPAWVSGQTYNFPTVVAATNGHSYRCTGTGVTTNPELDAANWKLLTVAPLSTFEYDGDGNLIPANPPTASSEWDIDENGDIMPKA